MGKLTFERAVKVDINSCCFSRQLNDLNKHTHSLKKRFYDYAHSKKVLANLLTTHIPPEKKAEELET